MTAHTGTTTTRNAPCPCGSGRKFKRCCGAGTQAAVAESDISATFLAAVSAYDSDELERAAAGFNTVLQQQADHAGALHHLGLVEFRQGRTAQGVKLIEESLALSPQDGAYMGNLGVVYLKTGRHADAIALFRRGLALRPEDAKLHFNLANASLDSGDCATAVKHCQTALALAPDNHDARFILGVAQYRQGDYAAAFKTLYSRAEQVPGHADTYYFLALATKALGDIANAELLLEHAIANNPCKSEYFLELAYICRDRLEYASAIAHFQRALSLPTSHAAEIYSHIGYAYAFMGNIGLALEHAEKGLLLKPEHASTQLAMGLALFKAGRTEEAIPRYLKAIELSSEPAALHKALLFILQNSALISEPALFEAHRRYARMLESGIPLTSPVFANPRDPHKRLRVGYVSADLWGHTLTPFIRPVLAQHNKQALEVYCYYNNSIVNEVSRSLQALADHWLPCSEMSDDELAARIREDGIDILVDLSGHTQGNRLAVFARRPAPLQVTWLGYTGTSGLDAMDYRITDACLDPPGLTEAFHSEKLLRLSASATFALENEPPEVNRLPALSGTPFTYACLNAHAKFSDETFRVWAEILKRAPSSRMMFGYADEAPARAYLTARFSEHGIDASRLVLMPKMPLDEFLMLHHQVDLALDPFPYNGGTTSILSILMGVPVVTLRGARTVSRCGNTLMRGVGLDEFVRETPEDYIALAVALGGRLEQLDALRKNLRAAWHRSAFGDPARYTRELEAAYRGMWREWLGTQPQPGPAAAQ